MSPRERYEKLLLKIENFIKDEEELENINKVFSYALEKLKDDKRLNGDMSIDHSLSIVEILVDIYPDYKAIKLALLHDLLHCDDVTYEDLESNFDKEIADLVEILSKISDLHFSVENEYLIENYKKILVGMSTDVRVLVVKLADRLDDMRSLWVFDEEHQKKKAKETLEIFVPIASRLGISKIKRELEDLSFRYLKPDVYFDIAEKIADMRIDLEEYLNEFKNEVHNLLKEHLIKHEIKGRSKSFYGIYNKLQRGKKFCDIYDILAIRVYVDTEEECYQVLGLIHSKFKQVPKRFKDYVAMPKKNMYQSLHTTVYGDKGNAIEVQIRTYDMDKIAEYGIAAHWSYKEKINQTEAMKNFSDQRLQLFRKLMNVNDDELNKDIDEVKQEFNVYNIYVYTPKGDVIELPDKATPIDFAYKLHSDIGDKLVSAIVNDNIVSLDYELSNNDVVKINTNPNSKGPNSDWLDIVKTSRAKNKIKNYFNKKQREDDILRGKDIFDKECHKAKVSTKELLNKENLKIIFESLKINDLDDLYQEIGNGKYTTASVIKIIYPENQPQVKKEIVSKESYDKTDIIVSNTDGIKVGIAKCCKPVPQDRIVGFISKNSGITIHRVICHNVSETTDRLIEARWNKDILDVYSTDVIIQTKKSDNVLESILNRASLCKVVIENVVTIPKTNMNVLKLTVTIQNRKHLINFLNSINGISDVYTTGRLIN